jgi:hypothetical protein
MINPFMFNSFVQGNWVSTSAPAYATISEGGRLFTTISAGWGCPAYVNKPKSTGKWFFAVELVSFCNLSFVYAVGVSSTTVLVSSPRPSQGQPTVKEYCYGKSAGSKKWINGVPSAYGTLVTAGGIVGISYDAGNGEVRGYRYVSGAWIDDGLITTLTANTQCYPCTDCNGGTVTQTSMRLRSDLGSPSGFILWV